MAKTGDRRRDGRPRLLRLARRARASASRRSTPTSTFSLVITDTESGDPVACGDILEPDADRFGEAGVAVVQLLPVGDSTVQGVAVIERTQLQRELDVTPTRVRIAAVDGRRGRHAGRDRRPGSTATSRAARVTAPTDRLRVQLKSRGDHDVRPYPRQARRIGRAGHRRLLRRAAGARVRPGGGVHRPASSRSSSPTPRAAIRSPAATSSSRTTTTSPRPDWRWSNSCRSATPACRASR